MVRTTATRPQRIARIADRVPVDQVIQARQVSGAGPGRFLLSLFLGVFFVLGWMCGRAWLMAVDCANSARIGYWRGKGMTAEQVRERLAPPPPG